MADVDRFLALYFRAQERRESPRSVSIGGSGGGGGYEAAQEAEASFAVASALMGTLARDCRITPGGYRVLRGYYLSLTPAHHSIVVRHGGQASARPVDASAPVPDIAADLQSMCDWRTLAESCGFSGSMARAACRSAFYLARAVVAEELDRRAELAARLGTVRLPGGVRGHG